MTEAALPPTDVETSTAQFARRVITARDHVCYAASFDKLGNFMLFDDARTAIQYITRELVQRRVHGLLSDKELIDVFGASLFLGVTGVFANLYPGMQYCQPFMTIVCVTLTDEQFHKLRTKEV